MPSTIYQQITRGIPPGPPSIPTIMSLSIGNNKSLYDILRDSCREFSRFFLLGIPVKSIQEFEVLFAEVPSGISYKYFPESVSVIPPGISPGILIYLQS